MWLLLVERETTSGRERATDCCVEEEGLSWLKLVLEKRERDGARETDRGDGEGRGGTVAGDGDNGGCSCVFLFSFFLLIPDFPTVFL